MADSKRPEKDENYRQCLYKGDESQIFVGSAAISKAQKAGWKDHPDQAKTTEKAE